MGKSKGFGFIAMDDPEDVQRVSNCGVHYVSADILGRGGLV
jgi:hypothetical protein